MNSNEETTGSLEVRYNLKEPLRLDTFLHSWFESERPGDSVSRSQVKRWIDQRKVLVNGEAAPKGGLLLEGIGVILVKKVIYRTSHLEPYNFPLDVIYEDEVLVVINKPAGISMHPGAGNRTTTLVNALLTRYGRKFSAGEASERPGIVHRLDKNTTGLVVVARDTGTLNLLSKQFATKIARRRYLALVLSTPRKRRRIDVADSGTISTRFGRHRFNRTRMAVLEEGGREATTHWNVRARFTYGTLIELILETGRTHQIRVHMAHVGTPVIGDREYGDFTALPKELRSYADEFSRQALHAYSLQFVHPKSGKQLEFEVDLPSDMQALVKVFKSYGRS